MSSATISHLPAGISAMITASVSGPDVATLPRCCHERGWCHSRVLIFPGCYFGPAWHPMNNQAPPGVLCHIPRWSFLSLVSGDSSRLCPLPAVSPSLFLSLCLCLLPLRNCCLSPVIIGQERKGNHQMHSNRNTMLAKVKLCSTLHQADT